MSRLFQDGVVEAGLDRPRTFRTFAKNFGSLYGANMTAKVANVALVIVAARYLGVEEFGRFSFIISLVALFLTFTDFGINFYVIREVARRRERTQQFVGNALVVKLFLALTAVILINALAKVVGLSHNEIIGLRVACLGLIFDTFIQQFYAGFRGHERMEYESLCFTVETLITASLGIVSVVLWRNLVYLLWAYVIAKGINLTLTYLLYSRRIGSVRLFVDLGFWKKLVLSALPFALNTVFGLVAFRLDVILLRLLREPYYVGIYRSALSIAVTVSIFAYMYQAAIYPILSRLFIESGVRLRQAVERSLGVLYLAALAAAIPLFWFASPVVRLLFGDEYAASATILRILVLMLPFKFVDQVLGITLDSINKQNIRPFIAGTAIAVNAALNLLLIHFLAARGAAVATVLTELTVSALYLRFVLRHLGWLSVGSTLLKGVVAAVASSPAMVLLGSLNVFAGVAGGLTIYCLALFLTRTHEDLGLELALPGVWPAKRATGS